MPIINKAHREQIYLNALSYKLAQLKELPSLPEFLAITSEEKPQSSFDDDSDKKLDALMAKRMQERQTEWRKKNE